MMIAFAAVAMSSAAYAEDSEKGPDRNFHLYLLVGQSNMAGRGAVDEESAKTDPRVVMFT